MSQKTKTEVMERLCRRYANAGREHRITLIDQAVEVMGYHRKSALRALARQPGMAMASVRRTGRPQQYDRELLGPALKTIWLAAQQPCGRRLVAMLPDWVPAYETHYRKLPRTLREQLLEASSATLDRLLKPVRAQRGKRVGGTKPGTMLRQEIPIRGGSWQADEAGWMEADTVSLGGGNASGEVVWVLDNTDICTTWVEMRAMFGRGQHATVQQLKNIEQRLPFPWLGLDSDNGGEFINRHVMSWCCEGRTRSIYYSRSRPYRSNDNAHVEQKNWTHVRHWFGYERHDNPEVVEMMNDLAREELGQFVNLFTASMKLDRKETSEGKEKRIYGRAATPYERVLQCGQATPVKKEELRALKARLNPFELERAIQKKLRAINGVRRALE